MRDRRSLVLLPLAALLAVLPLLLRGNSCGHDFEFHVYNWLEVGSQWRQGCLWPHWEFTAAANAGEPRFIFYPPLSWMTGALLGMVLPWSLVPVATIWLALTACGLTMHRLAQEWTGAGGALLAAGLYMVHPYMLFTFYERSAYAEMLAAAWLPLVLLAVLRPRVTVLGVAAPVALLWLTNDPAAVMGCYALALLGALRVGWGLAVLRRGAEGLREASKMAAGVGLGLALAGFYLVPAIVERSWVQIRMVAMPGVRVADNFLFAQNGSLSHRAILRTASICSVTLLSAIVVSAVVAMLAGAAKGQEGERRRFALVALTCLAVVAGFALTASSGWLWMHGPELKYLQFPWRFNAVLGCVAAAMVALAVGRLRIGFPLVAMVTLAVVAGLSFLGQSEFRQACNRGNDVASLVTDFQSGRVYDLTDEYTPVGSEPAAMMHGNPNAWIAAAPGDAAPEGAVRRYSVMLKDRLHFDITSADAAYLVINLREYPAWKIALNGVAVMSHPHRADGLMVVPIAKGESKIDLAYALTWDRIAGWLTTGVAVLAALWLRLR